VPLDVDADTLLDLESAQVLARLPVPDPELAVAVARGQELPVGGEVDSAGVPRARVPRELLLPVQLEGALAVVDYHLVVHGLASEVLPVRVHRRVRDRLHVGLADVLCHHGDTELPKENLLIISCGNESPSSFDESDGVDGALVFLVLLRDLTRVRIELVNLLVGAPSQENVLFIVLRVKLYAKRSLFGGETPDDLAALGVPELDDPVEAGAEEPAAVVAEAHVAHRLGMAHVRAEALAVGQYVPNLDGAVVAGGEEQVAVLGEELDALHAFVVAHPGVDPLLRDEALVLLGPQVGGVLHEVACPPRVVEHGSGLFYLSFLLLDRRLGFLDPLLAHLLVPLHEVFLFLGEVRLLGLELFHAIVNGPRTHKSATAGVSLLLSLHFQFLLVFFPPFRKQVFYARIHV